MAHPKSKVSKQRRDKRRSHDFLKTPELTTCSHCGEMVPRHQVCPECGYYRDKQLIVPKEENS